MLLTEGLWNSEFVGDFKDGKNLFVAGKPVDEAAFAEKETHGLVKWWNLELKDRTPAWGEKESLIPAAQIVRVARAMGKAAPKVTVWMGPGAAMHPRGTYSRHGGARAQWFGRLDRRRGRRVAERQRADWPSSRVRTSTWTNRPRKPARARSSMAVAPRTCPP